MTKKKLVRLVNSNYKFGLNVHPIVRGDGLNYYYYLFDLE